MKKQTFLLPVMLMMVPLFITVRLISFSTGAPTNASGSPGDNHLTCVQCHASNNTNKLGWITSTQLDNGYSLGQQYEMRAKAVKAGCLKFGFLITVERNNNKIGTPIATDATRTQIQNTHYITHTAAGSVGSDSAVWNFKWSSPSTPQSTVTFYGAFVGANGDSLNVGDQVYVSEKDVILYGTQGIPEVSAQGNKLYLFPNPADEMLNLDLDIPVDNATLNIYNTAGQLVKQVTWDHANIMQVDVSGLPNGTYLTRLHWQNDFVHAKLIIRHP